MATRQPYDLDRLEKTSRTTGIATQKLPSFELTRSLCRREQKLVDAGCHTQSLEVQRDRVWHHSRCRVMR